MAQKYTISLHIQNVDCNLIARGGIITEARASLGAGMGCPIKIKSHTLIVFMAPYSIKTGCGTVRNE